MRDDFVKLSMELVMLEALMQARLFWLLVSENLVEAG